MEDESKEIHERTGSIKPQKKKNQVIRVALIWMHTLKSFNNKTTKWQDSPHTYQY
jgi:hypothetical protein